MSGNSTDVDSSIKDSNQRAKEKLSTALLLKQEGNKCFTDNKIKEAIRRYHRALMYVKGIENDSSNMLDSIRSSFSGEKAENQKISPAILEKNQQLKLDCYNNLSACLLKTEQPDFEKVVFYSQEVIKITPNNPKAHFRKAQALYSLRDFEGALNACDYVISSQEVPDQKVLTLKTNCATQLLKQSSHQKVMYSKMLGLNK